MRYYFAAYDVHGDRLWMHQKARKRAVEVLEFLADLRSRYPADQRIHLMMDNLSTHATAAVRAYCRANRIRFSLFQISITVVRQRLPKIHSG